MRFLSCVRWRTSTMRVRGRSRWSRSSPGGIQTVGRVPLRWSWLSPRTSSLSVLLISPIISFALRACTSLGRQPAASISSTIQYQLPIVSTATGEPGSHRARNCCRAPRSCGSRCSRTRRQRGNSARRKPRSSSGRSGERVVELSGRPQASRAYRKRGACKALSSGGRRNRAGSAIPTPSRIQHSGMRSPAEYRSDLDGTHSPPPVSVTAEFDEIATGERTPGLLQAATRRETAEIDRREAETLDELLDECGRFAMGPPDEDHATSSVLDRPFIEAGRDDRIERLDDAGTWCQGRHDLARALAAEVGEDELRTRLDEGIRRIDEHPAVPGGEALQRRLDVSPGHGQQHVVEARGFLDRGTRPTTAQTGRP